MHTEQIATYDPFQMQFLEHVAADDDSELLKKLHLKAWDHFLELGLPQSRHESFQYMRLKLLFAEKFSKATACDVSVEQIQKAILPECQHSNLIFVNGAFRSDLSDTSALSKSIVIQSIKQAVRPYGALLSNAWAKSVKEETDTFVALNFACHQDGAFVYVPPKLVVDTPIQVLHVISSEDDLVWMMPRFCLFQGASSELILISTSLDLSCKKHFYNSLMEVTIEENASLQLIGNAFHERTTSGWVFDALRGIVKRSARLKVVQLTSSNEIIRHDSKIQLAGEAAETSLNGVWLLDKEKEVHTNVVIEHQEPYTHSTQLFKGVLTDFSHSSFQGKIKVLKKAQKTEAYQLNNNLVLSENAEANSKPNLEVFADDVKASHGATVGQLDAEEMFYLKTRGFSEMDARRALITGFCNQVVELIPIPSLCKQATQFIQRFIN